MDENQLKWHFKILRLFCRQEYLEEIEGDLLERFEKRPSSWRLTIEILKLLRPSLTKLTASGQKLNHYAMFKHNLKFGWRNLLKQKPLFLINIFGLAIGISTCLVISLFIIDELSYDKFNKNADRIARVILKGQMQGESINEAITPAGVAPAFQEDFPEVQIGTRIRATEVPLINNGKENFRESRFAYADPNFFEVFSIRFVKGDAKTALEGPNSIVITESEAKKYFGSDDAVGKILEFKEWNKKFKVTGIIADMPLNSHFHFELLASMEGYENANNSDWLNSEYHSYILLSEDAKFAELQPKIPAIVSKYMGRQLQEAFGISMSQFQESGNQIGLFLQPLEEIHLYSYLAPQTELESGGDINSLYIFAIIALFALVVSCINFINLSTAAASRRMKEVGIKKVLGSGKSQLVIQFMSESLITTLVAILVSSVIISLSLPFFNEISGKDFHVVDFLKPSVLASYLAFGILVSFLAGIYPSFVLSSFRPLSALSRKTNSRGGVGLRSSLVVFQFAISTALIIGTLIVNQQMDFIQEKDLGYEKEGLIVIKDSHVLGQGQQHVFKEKILAHSSVESATVSNHLPAGPTNSSMDNVYLGEGSQDFRRSPVYHVDEKYIPTLGIKLLKGRNFSAGFGAESNYVIVNETFASTFGLEEDPVGKTIETNLNQQGSRHKSIIIGLVKDFHFQSLHRKIEPLIIRKNPSSGVIIRSKVANIPSLLADIDDMWKELSEEPFNYTLLDDLYNQTYAAEQNVGTLFKVFASFTVLIAVLGLFGLVTFTVERRTKEIGIRKTLGSSKNQIVSLISLDFVKLVAIALILAFPVGYFAMSLWLDDFAYRIEINWWVFAMAGAITLAVSWTTVAAKSWKAAIVNPVDVLKDE